MWVLAACVFQGIDPFYLDYQICSCRVDHSIPSLSFEFPWDQKWYILFLVLVLLVLPKGLFILLTCTENQLLILLDFSIHINFITFVLILFFPTMPPGLWDVNSLTRDQNLALVVKVPSPIAWIGREFPALILIISFLLLPLDLICCSWSTFLR